MRQVNRLVNGQSSRQPIKANVKSRGFTIIEAAMSILIISMVFIGSMKVLTVTHQTKMGLEQNQLAEYLAQDLIHEIQTCVQTQGTLEYDESAIESGLKLSDTHTVQEDSRIFFTTIDDFDGWTSTPPQDQLGIDIPQAKGLTRSITITYVDPENLPQTTTEVTTHRLVTVMVSKGASTLATQSIVLTESAQTSHQLSEALR